MQASQRPAKPVRNQAIMTVRSVERLSPQLVRVVVGSPGFADYSDNPNTDKYVKLLFADPTHGLTPPYDMEGLRKNDPEKLPVRRTYTVRFVDEEKQELTLDFVTHGDSVGIAAPWAVNAKVGDTLVLTGAGGGYTPDPEAGFHVLAGDLAALPAICSAVEAMDENTKGVVIMATDTEEDQLAELEDGTPAGVEIRWVRTQGRDNVIVEELAKVPWPEDLSTVQGFVHGEREHMKGIRKYLINELGLQRAQLSLSAYWADGRVEDEFQAEKRLPIGQIFED